MRKKIQPKSVFKIQKISENLAWKIRRAKSDACALTNQLIEILQEFLQNKHSIGIF